MTLSRFFRKPPPPPPTVTQRIAALAAAPTEDLAPIALGGDDEELRVAAIGMLPDTDALRRLAGVASDGGATPTPTRLRQAAQARLARLADEGALDLATLGTAVAHRSAVLAVATLCREETHLLQLLAGITDAGELSALVLDSPASRVRQLAAAAIADPALLQELLRQVRGKDKTVYRQIKDRLAARAAVEREAADAAREADAVCAALEQHSLRPHDPLYSATVDVLAARWSALGQRPDAALEERVQQALRRCREVIEARAQSLARAAAEQAAEQAALVAAQAAAHAATEHAREAAEQARQAAEQPAAAPAGIDEAAAADAPDAPDAPAELAPPQAPARTADEQALRRLGGLIRLAKEVLQAGNTRKAATLRRTIEEQWPTTPAAVPPHLARSLQQLDGKLSELRRWKDFAVAPKRLELVEEMEALVGLQEEPKALAQRIQAVQQEWRTLNKGIASPAPEEEARFQAAHKAAFQPCREYFAAQAAVRRDNLAQRKRVLERVKAFEATQAGEGADRARILDVLREAPGEWRGHGPVDREAAAALQAEFDAALDRLRGLLNAWHDQHAANRQALIAQARQLAAGEDIAGAIEGVKRLQAQWRDAGPLPRERDQPLWSEFREICDATFRKREASFARHAAGLEAAKAQVVALCDDVQAAARLEPPTRAEGSARLLAWRAAFEAAGELPRADARSLRDRFERALSQYESLLAQQDRRGADAAVANLFAAARHVRAYERALDQGIDGAELEALKVAAEGFIAGVPRWPSGGLAAVRQALAQAGTPTPDDGSRERQLRTLCIRGELFGATPTPPEDEALRREYQMRQLVQSMGQGDHADERDWNSMMKEWVGIRAIAADAHDGFEQRFLRCLAQRPVKAPDPSPFRHHDGTDRMRRDRDGGDRRPRRDDRRR